MRRNMDKSIDLEVDKLGTNVIVYMVLESARFSERKQVPLYTIKLDFQVGLKMFFENPCSLIGNVFCHLSLVGIYHEYPSFEKKERMKNFQGRLKKKFD